MSEEKKEGPEFKEEATVVSEEAPRLQGGYAEPGPEPATGGPTDASEPPAEGGDGTEPAIGGAPPEGVDEVPSPAKPTPSEAFAMGAQYFAGAEWDLAVLRAAGALRGNPERFKAARALPGGSKVQ